MNKPIPKHPALKSKALRNSARGQECTLDIGGVCNHDTDTTVLHHLREFGGGGMGYKPSDFCGIFVCSDCHDYSHRGYTSQYEWQGIARAIVRTHEKMLELGVLKL